MLELLLVFRGVPTPVPMDMGTTGTLLHRCEQLPTHLMLWVPLSLAGKCLKSRRAMN